jgi:ABC-type glycerol-3-phosphate transport system substrate-binding protein
MKKVRIVVMLILAGLFASLVAGCNAVSSDEKKEIVAFYTEFAKEATSLDSEQIAKTYTSLAGQDFTGQSFSDTREKMFKQFAAINPDFFAKMHLTGSSYSEVGKSYSTVLLLSLATEGTGVEVVMPSNAVTSYQDEKLGKRVYEIDRTKITATVPEALASKITRPNRNGLAPVKIIKDGESWKVLADNNMLTEIGIPLKEKISTPTASK